MIDPGIHRRVRAYLDALTHGARRGWPLKPGHAIDIRTGSDGRPHALLLADVQALTLRRAAGDLQPPPDRVVPFVPPRQAQVLELTAQGMTDAQIGTALFLTTDTVKTHHRQLKRQFAAVDRAALIATAVLQGVLVPSADHTRLVASVESAYGDWSYERLGVQPLAAAEPLAGEAAS
jgi:DNA-binding CsgD family transcriptional regulator